MCNRYNIKGGPNDIAELYRAVLGWNYDLPQGDILPGYIAPGLIRNLDGERELVPMKSQQAVPNAIIAPFWAIAHPLQAWKIFVPDPNAPPPGKPDVVPPPIFRWGP